MKMNGFNPYHFDPWMMHMMMHREPDMNADKQLIKLYKRRLKQLEEDAKKPKDDKKKPDDKMNTQDWLLFIILTTCPVIMISSYMIMSQIIKLAEVLHR